VTKDYIFILRPGMAEWRSGSFEDDWERELRIAADKVSTAEELSKLSNQEEYGHAVFEHFAKRNRMIYKRIPRRIQKQ